jgi:hypothetical protein
VEQLRDIGRIAAVMTSVARVVDNWSNRLTLDPKSCIISIQDFFTK